MALNLVMTLTLTMIMTLTMTLTMTMTMVISLTMPLALTLTQATEGWTLDTLNQAITHSCGLPAGVQCIYFQGKALTGTSPLIEQGVQRNSTLDLRVRHRWAR